MATEKTGKTERIRMMVDLSSDVQMAIKLRAVKSNMTTGAVVCEAVQTAFSKDIQEARSILAETKSSAKK
jgi:hypothetical protein